MMMMVRHLRVPVVPSLSALCISNEHIAYSPPIDELRSVRVICAKRFYFHIEAARVFVNFFCACTQ